jgi:uncharacterized membrane protein YqjE
MDGASAPPVAFTGAVKRILYRLLAIGENRFLLLLAEIEEERNRLLDTLVLAVVMAGLALLGAMAWSAALVLLFWPISPVGTLLLLGALYLLAAGLICWRMASRPRQPQVFCATLDQLKKDRACLLK